MKSKKTIQVDFDPLAHGRFHAITVPLFGEIGRTAELLLKTLPDALVAEDQRAELRERRGIWREEKAARAADDQGHGLASARVFAALSAVAPDDAVIALDVGNNTYAFGRYFESTSQQVVMSGYLGSIGFALPAAMGCWAAVRGARKVLAISGDGGLGQYLAELTTVVKYGMDITVIVLNNGQLGKITKEQQHAHLMVWETDLVNPDFAAYAELCGARGFRVTTAEALEPTLREAIAHPGPALVELLTDPELN